MSGSSSPSVQRSQRLNSRSDDEPRCPLVANDPTFWVCDCQYLFVAELMPPTMPVVGSCGTYAPRPMVLRFVPFPHRLTATISFIVRSAWLDFKVMRRTNCSLPLFMTFSMRLNLTGHARSEGR